MKYCDEYAALLDLFVDGELSPEEMAQVQAHLDACPDCRAYVDDALALRAAFPDIEDTVVPDGFADGVMAAVRASSRPEPAAPKTAKRPWARVLVPLAACCAIVILLRGPLSARLENEAAMDTSASTSAASESFAYTTEEPAAESAAEAAPESVEDCADISAQTANRQSDGASAQTPSVTADDSASAETEPGETPAASAGGMGSGTAVSGITDKTAADAGYFTTLFLPPEASELLAAYTPFEEDETASYYALPGEQYETLLTQLASIDFGEQLHPEIDSDTFLVVLDRS